MVQMIYHLRDLPPTINVRQGYLNHVVGREVPLMKYTSVFGAVSQAAKSVRIAQIRLLGRALIFAGRSRLGRKLISGARDNHLTGSILRWLLAFYGTFSSLAEATHCAARYIPASHDHPILNELHSEFAEITRESDYPVLFFLAPISSDLRTVFDLGGSI